MATYDVTITLLSVPMDFAAGTEQGQWKFTCSTGALVQFEDLPTTTFVGLPDGTHTFTGQAFNDTETIGLGPIETSQLTLPLAGPGEPGAAGTIIITDWYNKRGQVRALLWAEVPEALQDQFATVGLASKWPLATTAENDAIEAGEVAELGIWVTRGVKTEAQVRAELVERWTRYNAGIQDAGALSHEDTVLVEAGIWVKRVAP
jgi:hypothetical protein